MDCYDICETRDTIRLTGVAGNQTLPAEILARGRLLAADGIPTMKPFVYLSYGMPKSGSTLAFELTKAVFEQNNYPQTRLSGLVEAKHALNFMDDFSDEAVERLSTAVERIGHPIVVKTHGHLTPAAHRLLENRGAIGHCVYRDPREVILSLLDAGEKARRLGHRAFSEMNSIEYAAKRVTRRIEITKAWMAAPNIIPLFYSDTAFKTPEVVQIVADQIGLPVDAEKAERTVKSSKFTQFNKGRQDRHLTDLSPEQNEELYLRFKDFIDTHCHSLLDVRTVQSVAGQNVPDAVTPAPDLGDASRRVSANAAHSGVRPVGRTERCPCGSGKRYKECHGLLS